MQKLFNVPKQIASPQLRVFLFPYAGGSMATYFDWANHFSNSDKVELVLVQPPGRGSRMSEPPHQTMRSLIGELTRHKSFITDTPYAFFGHSLGARVAYSLACELKTLVLPDPQFLVASGSGAPHLEDKESSIHDLPRDQFVDKLRELNGTPDELLSNDEFLDFLLPLLRADFKIADEYRCSTAMQLDCPIHVLGGTKDPSVSDSQLRAWAELTAQWCEVDYVEGDHFFIDSNRLTVIEILKKLTR